jgi:hypothetical protein
MSWISLETLPLITVSLGTPVTHEAIWWCTTSGRFTRSRLTPPSKRNSPVCQLFGDRQAAVCICFSTPMVSISPLLGIAEGPRALAQESAGQGPRHRLKWDSSCVTDICTKRLDKLGSDLTPHKYYSTL